MSWESDLGEISQVFANIVQGKPSYAYFSVICCSWIAYNHVSINPLPVKKYEAIFVKPEDSFLCIPLPTTMLDY